MTRDQANKTVEQLVAMTTQQADSALCRMPNAHLMEIGTVLGMRLPESGGDKPAQIGAALQLRRIRKAG